MHEVKKVLILNPEINGIDRYLSLTRYIEYILGTTTFDPKVFLKQLLPPDRMLYVFRESLTPSFCMQALLVRHGLTTYKPSNKYAQELINTITDNLNPFTSKMLSIAGDYVYGREDESSLDTLGYIYRYDLLFTDVWYKHIQEITKILYTKKPYTQTSGMTHSRAVMSTGSINSLLIREQLIALIVYCKLAFDMSTEEVCVAVMEFLHTEYYYIHNNELFVGGADMYEYTFKEAAPFIRPKSELIAEFQEDHKPKPTVVSKVKQSTFKAVVKHKKKSRGRA